MRHSRSQEGPSQVGPGRPGRHGTEYDVGGSCLHLWRLSISTLSANTTPNFTASGVIAATRACTPLGVAFPCLPFWGDLCQTCIKTRSSRAGVHPISKVIAGVSPAEVARGASLAHFFHSGDRHDGGGGRYKDRAEPATSEELETL